MIMLTGRPDMGTAIHCLKIGAYDYLTKPVDEDELLISVDRALERRDFLILEKQYQDMLETQVKKKTWELECTQKEVIYRLALAAEYRDEDTWKHLMRLSHSSRLLAETMGFPQELCDSIQTVSPLHDVGKIGIPDTILLKPGRLTQDEYTLMKTHSTIGANILHGSNSTLVRMARDIALYHHERYDGSGYPNGSKGEDIPISARIVAVVDVFDALRSKRPYKEAWSIEESVKAIREGNGTQFDPAVVDSFLACVESLAQTWEISEQFNGDGMNCIERIMEISQESRSSSENLCGVNLGGDYR